MWKNKNAHVLEVLNDLIKINNGRISFYQQAMGKANIAYVELKPLFNEIISESEKNIQELSNAVALLNITPEDMVVTTGRIHTAWAALKMNFAGITVRSIMSACKYNQDITRHAYLAALNSNIDIHPDIRQLLEDQMKQLNNTSLLINSSREVHHFAYAPYALV